MRLNNRNRAGLYNFISTAILLLFVPVLRDAFKLHMLDQNGWMMAAVLGLFPLTALELYKALCRVKK